MFNNFVTLQRFIIFVFLAAAVPNLWASDADTEWLSVKQGYFTIYYHYEDFNNTRYILNTIAEHIPLLTGNTGLQINRGCEIYLSSKPAEFGELTGWRLPPWTQGVAIPQKRIIILKSPRFSGSKFDLGRAAVHEFVHILVYSEAGNIPLWLNEGLAVLLSGEGYFNSQELSHAVLMKKVVSFDEMEDVLRFESMKANLTYQQALSATQYLVKEFGWEAVQKIFSNMKQGESFQEAFFHSTGLWLDEFEAEWAKELHSQYRWAFLKDLDYLIFLLFGPIVLIGGFLMWRRRRRIIKQWEIEDRYYDSEDYTEY
ncbi:hypothetical protein ISS30_10175 [bacterium]|nr:hypothetical protein [FCB group bacterium]MBL7192051.1 hypothetical protein [bacterium]